MKDKAAVVIPIHKAVMTEWENISFRQCLKVLGKYPIRILAPIGLDIRNYLEPLTDLQGEFFPPSNLQSSVEYNRMLLTYEFYERFREFQYILIYQLDAFVFRDELADWCERGYDYVGAPWINSETPYKVYSRATYSPNPLIRFIKRNFNFNKKQRVLVGNGGFSLRKVKSFLRVSKILHYVGNIRTHQGSLRAYRGHEDIIWSIYVPTYIPGFKIPDVDEALKFAFELEPRYCYEKNNNQLPFGCHAWEKHDFSFWKPFLIRAGYDV